VAYDARTGFLTSISSNCLFLRLCRLRLRSPIGGGSALSSFHHLSGRTVSTNVFVKNPTNSGGTRSRRRCVLKLGHFLVN
jgi:hypothetical protein